MEQGDESATGEVAPRSVESAYEALKLRIVRGDFSLGEPLDFDLLQQRLSIGRTRMREITQRLIEAGLVRTLPNRGTFVNHVSTRDLVQAIDARIAFEPVCARLVAQRLDENRLRQLVRLVEEPKSSARFGDTQPLVHSLDYSFHSLFYAASGNPHVENVLTRLFTFTTFAANSLCSPTQPIEQVQSELRAVLDAVGDRDPEAAAEALRRHVAAFREVVVKQYVDIHDSVNGRAFG